MAGTLTASVIKNDTTSPPAFQNSAGTEIGTLCRAWVRYSTATGASVVNASFNVSSVTYNGTGDVTINFTNAFADGSYAFGAMGDDAGPNVISVRSGVAPTASALRLWMGKPNVSANNGIAGVVIFR